MAGLIRVYDINREYLGTMLDNAYGSMEYTASYHSIGTFALSIPYVKRWDAGILELLKPGRLIQIDDRPDRVGIIRASPIISRDVSGAVVLSCEGQTLDGLLQRRIILPAKNTANLTGYNATITRTGAAETVMKAWIDITMVTPEDAERKITSIRNAPDQARGSIVRRTIGLKALNQEIADIALDVDLGWHIQMDNRGFVFDVAEGRDLSIAGQRVIFSAHLFNLISGEYSTDASSYANLGYVSAGSGEDESALPITKVFLDTVEPTGLNRIEKYYDIGIADTVSDLQSLGRASLRQNSIRKTTKVTVEPNGVYHYGVDYMLGDIVTVNDDDFGISITDRIVEVKETYQNGRMQVEPVIGVEMATLISAIIEGG